MAYIFQVYIIFSILALFKDIKLGISLYLFYFILVPVDLPMLFTSTNTIFHLFLFLSLILNRSKTKRNVNFSQVIQPFRPIIILYIVFFLFTPFQEYVPFGREFQVWQNEMRVYFILPVVMWYVARIDSSSVKYFNYSVLGASLIVLLYGLYLMQFDGFNPYVMYLANMTDITLSDTILGLNDQFRLIRRISSVFMHPMNYGLFLTLLTCYLLSYRNNLNKIFFIFFIALDIVCLFYCGIRTPIVAFFFAVVTYLLLIRNFNISLGVLTLGVVGLIIISYVPELKGTIDSIYNKDSEMGGSSIEMRIAQLNGCFREISDCDLVGKGYEWSMYYLGQNGSHPTILTFESVIFRLLCNWGIIGIILYVLAYIRFTANTYKMTPNVENKAICVAFIFAFLIYCIGTGDYQYTTLFMLFYSMFIINLQVQTEYIIKRK